MPGVNFPSLLLLRFAYSKNIGRNGQWQAGPPLEFAYAGIRTFISVMPWIRLE